MILRVISRAFGHFFKSNVTTALATLNIAPSQTKNGFDVATAGATAGADASAGIDLNLEFCAGGDKETMFCGRN